IEMDENWGRPSAPGDYARINRPSAWKQTPAILGSSRNGPDLTNIGERQPSAVWQYMHLYNPRSVVKESIMPSFPWLFKVVDDPDPEATTVSMPEGYGPSSGTIVATEDAKALITYLQSLKQVPVDAEPTAQQQAAADSAAESAAAKEADGASIYSNHCTACHQNNGEGVTGAFPSLVAAPYVTNEAPTNHIRAVLYGMQGIT